MRELIQAYSEKLCTTLELVGVQQIAALGSALRNAWQNDQCVYLCGNGGSAGNAIHLANDLLYGAGLSNGRGLRVEALSANASVLTCLANDIGYEEVFSEQLRAKANPNDLLIALSGSGNSANIVKALEMGNALGMYTHAIVAFTGGKCKSVAQHFIHFEIDDMQIAEDLQLVVGHMCMRWLHANPIRKVAR